MCAQTLVYLSVCSLQATHAICPVHTNIWPLLWGWFGLLVCTLSIQRRLVHVQPILSLPGPEPATPEPIYPPQPPYQDEQGQWQPGFSGDTGSPDAPWTPEPGRQLSDSYEDIFYTAAGTCPNGRITEITAGAHPMSRCHFLFATLTCCLLVAYVHG